MIRPLSSSFSSLRWLRRVRSSPVSPCYLGHHDHIRLPSRNLQLSLTSSVSTSSSDPKQNKALGLGTGDGSTPLKETKGEQAVGGAETGGDAEEFKDSFGKEIFLGRFDYSLLTFPEVLDKERHETLHEMLEPIERFFNEKVDSKKIDEDAKIPDTVLQGLKELGLYGQQVPLEYGGLGLNATEYARLQEIISLDGSIAVTLAAHQTIGYKGLLLYGTEEQKNKYLPRLASGELTAAFALTEPSSGSDAGSIQTRARLAVDGSHWVLNGGKIWISNGGTADFFTVFARSADDAMQVAKSSKCISAFIVERQFGGVTNGKPEDKHGIRGSNTAEVHFDNTVVPLENMLGDEGDGFRIAMNILNSGRFSMGSAGAGFLKKLMGMVAEHAINRKQFGKPLSEFGLIREKFVKMATDIYVMEAMAYTTAGLIDSGEYKDCAQEAAMVKIFSSEAGYNGIHEGLQILGGLGYMKDYQVERALRDARIMSIFEGTNEILRLLVALNGVKHAGTGLRELVRQLRNPFQFPTLAWQKHFQRRRQMNDNPKMTLVLKDYLHPTLEPAANALEYCVLRLQYATECLLQEYGTEILEQQVHLKRLADCAIDIYGMTCALSRASRSYCIGLRNSQVEMYLAELFVLQARHRVSHNVRLMLGGTRENGDDLAKAIADEIFNNKGYCAEHPLTRNFW